MVAADPRVKNAILRALNARENGAVEGRNNGELRERLGVNSSNWKFKRALGSLIHAGVLVWHRPAPTGISCDSRPITVRLA